MPQEKEGSYRSFLLRCWQEARASPDQPPLWRFVLQDVAAGQEQHAFGSFEQLVTFLRNEILGEKGFEENG